MEESYKNVLSETSFILRHLEKEMLDKIPENILELIEKHRNKKLTKNKY